MKSDRYDRVFSATVLAAAFWFILNPDFKSKVANADRNTGAPADTSPAGGSRANAKTPSRGIASVIEGSDSMLAGSSGSASGGVAPPAASRIVYENILIQIGPDDSGGCYANIVEAPALAGSPISIPPTDCRMTNQFRGSAIYDAAKGIYTEFEPNTIPGDYPYDRRVIARWKNYGALCPKDECSTKELVFLDDGAIRVRGTDSGPGKLTFSELKTLRETFPKIIATSATDRRIEDPKFSEIVEMTIIPENTAFSLVRADYPHATVYSPPIPETFAACSVLNSKTPTDFCSLLGKELANPGPTPTPTRTSGGSDLPPPRDPLPTASGTLKPTGLPAPVGSPTPTSSPGPGGNSGSPSNPKDPANSSGSTTTATPSLEKLLAMPDEELAKVIEKGPIGKCELADARKCPQCFCQFYFRSTIATWNSKGWPLNPNSRDSTGCVSQSSWPGYTAAMVGPDLMKNAAAQLRDALAHPSDPCAVRNPSKTSVTPADVLGH